MNNLATYKKALVLERQLSEAIKIVELFLNSSDKYRHLAAFNVIIQISTDNLTLLQIQLQQQRHIIKNKGFTHEPST